MDERLHKLNAPGSHNRLWILWPLEHLGLEGIEAADKLAQRGAETPLYRPKPFRGIRKRLYWMSLLEIEPPHHGRMRNQVLAGMFNLHQEEP